jgi:hypothetical protein
VARLFMPFMLLSKIIFVKKGREALGLDWTESGLIYKYYVTRIAEDTRTSHEEHSALDRAANASLNEDAAMIGDPNSVLADMKSD